MTPDVNVLIAASRDEHVHHLKARDWLLEACAQSALTRAGAGQPGGTLRLITHVMSGFLRLVTKIIRIIRVRVKLSQSKK